MVWNEEEAQKTHLFGDLKPTNMPLTLEVRSAKTGYRKLKTSSRNQQGDKPTVCIHWQGVCGPRRAMEMPQKSRFYGLLVGPHVEFRLVGP